MPMIRWLWPLLLLAAGCRTWPVSEQGGQPATAPGVGQLPQRTEIVEPAVVTPGHLDLAGLWALAVQHNPELREAAADVDVARGQIRQAGAYLNPRLSYQEDVVGSRLAP